MSTEHQPGSPGVDEEAVALVGSGYLEEQLRTHGECKDDCPAWKRIAMVALAELRTLRARVEELETEVETRNEQLNEVDYDLAMLAARAESAEAWMKELEEKNAREFRLFDGAMALAKADVERGLVRITDLESQLAAAREELADRRTCSECRDPEGCYANGTCYECAGLTFDEIMRLREESGLEAKVREALGERFGLLNLHRLFSGHWRAEWGSARRAHAATLPALLRAILEVEAKS